MKAKQSMKSEISVTYFKLGISISVFCQELTLITNKREDSKFLISLMLRFSLQVI